MKNKLLLLLIAVAVVASMGSCSLIDDQLDSRDKTRTIDFRLHIYSDIDSVLASQITTTDGQELRNVLSTYYKTILYPSSYNIDLDFYDAATNTLRTSDNETIRGNNETLTFSLPSGDLRCVAQTDNPLYSGRLSLPEQQSSYTLHLYPADAYIALAAKVDNSISNVLVTVEGCASSFNAIDSTYTYYNNVDSLVYRQEASTATWRTYAKTVLPSQPSKAWTITVYATTATGSITRTVLTINKPLLPGDIRIFQISIGADGSASTTSVGVGASVTLDWKKGGDYNPEI